MSKLTLEDLQVKGKKVFLRVDFNVPLDENQQVTDTSRIKAAIPTIKYLLDKGARLVIYSHLGRPTQDTQEQHSLLPVATALETILKKEVSFSILESETHKPYLVTDLAPLG